MAIQTPQIPPSTPDPEIEAGVIEDARARQRRHRHIAAALIAAALAAGALILGVAGGGGGGRAGGDVYGRPSGSGAVASSGHANPGKVFPAAPSTQRYGVSVGTDNCPLAPRNRYLPAWSGCVTARVADLSGNGRPDLILIYSRLSHSHVDWSGAPASIRRLYPAKQAMLRVVTPAGATTTTPILLSRSSALRWPTASTLLSVAHVNDDPGDEIFLRIQQISSGAVVVAYSLYHSRLIPAGADLSYGGDSGAKSGFDCLAGDPPQLIQHGAELVGPTIGGFVKGNGIWKQTEVTYAWHGPRLVKIAQRTFKHHGLPPASEANVGAGCTTGIG